MNTGRQGPLDTGFSKRKGRGFVVVLHRFRTAHKQHEPPRGFGTARLCFLKEWGTPALSLCDEIDLKIELIVDGLVTEAVKERTGAVLDVILRAVHGDLAAGCCRGIAFGSVGEELNGLGSVLDREISYDLVVAFSVLRDGAGDNQLSSRVVVHAEEVIGAQVTHEFGSPLAFEVGATDGGHINVKRTADEDTFVEINFAAFDFHSAGVVARYFVARPNDDAAVGIYVVRRGRESGHSHNGQNREEEK
jgi:hypothetical protein